MYQSDFTLDDASVLSRTIEGMFAPWFRNCFTKTGHPVIQCCEESSFHDLFQRRKGVLGFGPNRVIRVDFGIADRAVPVDDQAGGHRQRPALIAIVFVNFNAELFVYRYKIIGHPVFDTVLIGDRVARIAQEIESKVFFLLHGLIVSDDLGRNHDKDRALFFEL